MHLNLVTYLFTVVFATFVYSEFIDICGLSNGKRFYLEHGENGSLVANYQSNLWHEKNRNSKAANKCTIEFITCPSCVVSIKFRYLNISRNCGKASVLDTCGCDYVWVYEPPVENSSGEQYCGRFIQNNVSQLNYISQTRTVALEFIYSNAYGYAFALDYLITKNRVHLNGYPKFGKMNNVSQYISSPFFPYLYPIDLSVEYVINCESVAPCRISLIFTDFLIADSSIIEFFDWNGQRMFVTSGNVFRPPAVVTTGPSLVVRFYANGASNFGFKATYSYILGNINDLAFTPNVGCGGFVNTVGGAITMMNMVEEGIKFFDCVWIIKPPDIFQHRKTHLYVKVVNFTDFAGTTDIVIRQGLTSNQPAVEVLKHPMAHFSLSRQVEHVVPITQGFYIRLRGHFGLQTQLAIVFAAFNYKDCFSGADFLCQNLRCISILLNCDGFDHCGDSSDESIDCSLGRKDYRDFSKIPNFLFPKIEPYSDITTATFVFLTCSFGLIGIILAMALLLHRVNVRARQQRQIQDHLETIHAILEEGVGEVEEEIIIPDEPPDYEAPPEYEDVLKLKYAKKIGVIRLHNKSLSQGNFTKNLETLSHLRAIKSFTNLTTDETVLSLAGTSQIGQFSPLKVPNSPPPPYENISNRFDRSNENCNNLQHMDIEFGVAGPSNTCSERPDSTYRAHLKSHSLEERALKYLEVSKYSSQMISGIKRSISYSKSINIIKQARKIMSCSEESLVRYFSDSELIYKSNVNINGLVKARKSKLKKSFSSDDLPLL